MTFTVSKFQDVSRRSKRKLHDVKVQKIGSPFNVTHLYKVPRSERGIIRLLFSPMEDGIIENDTAAWAASLCIPPDSVLGFPHFLLCAD